MMLASAWPPDAWDRPWVGVDVTVRQPCHMPVTTATGCCQDGWGRQWTAVNKPARWESALNPDPQGCLKETQGRAALPLRLTQEIAAFPPRRSPCGPR